QLLAVLEAEPLGPVRVAPAGRRRRRGRADEDAVGQPRIPDLEDQGLVVVELGPGGHGQVGGAVLGYLEAVEKAVGCRIRTKQDAHGCPWMRGQLSHIPTAVDA